MGNTLKHWLKFDHITFLLIGPLLIVAAVTRHWLPLSVAFGAWTAALVYDLTEKQERGR